VLPPRKVVLIGAPWCEGQNLEGTDLGPAAVRDAGLGDAVKSLGLEWLDYGDVDFSSIAPPDHPLHEHHYAVSLYREWLNGGAHTSFSTWMHSKDEGTREKSLGKRSRSHKSALNEPDAAEDKPPINVVNAELLGSGLKLLHDQVLEALSAGEPPPFVLTVGGDHSIASGTISALASRHPKLGVVWVDAHADLNTPRTSPSGHYHGMPAAHLMGFFDKPGELGVGVSAGSTLRGFEWFPSGCLPESKLAYIGLRDVDVEEGRMLRESGVRVFTMRDVDKHGIARVCEMAIEAVGPSYDCPLHLSLDIDSVDPHFAPGTGTCARGGLTYREIHYICEECALTNRLVSMDLVEVNPLLEPPLRRDSGSAMHGDHPAIKPASPTVHLAVELALSALGKKIC